MFTVIKLDHAQEDGRIDDEHMSVVGYDIGETFICRRCALFGFHSSLAICFGDDVRSLTAEQLVGEMDVRETFADVPTCGNCGDKLISEVAFRLADYDIKTKQG